MRDDPRLLLDERLLLDYYEMRDDSDYCEMIHGTGNCETSVYN